MATSWLLSLLAENTTRVYHLRHSAASIMASRGVLPHDLMRILGHTKIATTMEIYVDSKDEALDAVAVRMGLALG
jgi:integrase